MFAQSMVTDFFDIEVLQEDKLASYLFIICLNYILQMSIDLIKENGLALKKQTSRWYPTETMIDADNTDNLVLLTNTFAQAESLLRLWRKQLEALVSTWM